MKFAQRIDKLKPYLFVEISKKIREKRAAGVDIVTFAIGDPVKGGIYSEFPSMRPEDLEEGDLKYNFDFRGVYGTIAERWLGLDASTIVGGKFEQLDFV